MENMLILLFCLVTLIGEVKSRVSSHIKVIVWQGVLLFLIFIFDSSSAPLVSIVFIAIEVLLIRAIIIPIILKRILGSTDSHFESEHRISSFYSLLIMALLFISGFFFAYIANKTFSGISPLQLGMSISTILMGLYLILIRKKMISHIMGYVIMENGILLLSFSLLGDMPLLISVGVLIDFFIGILLFRYYTLKIFQNGYDKRGRI
ncbi:MAG: hypothetical protein NTX05_01645 [Fusobacteria bacterium]|nr:hypothetical protein [Fusobacteriota bacterium]